MSKEIRIRLSEYVAEEMNWKADMFYQYESPEVWRNETNPDWTDDQLKEHGKLMSELRDIKPGYNDFSRELAEYLHDEMMFEDDKCWFNSGCLRFRNRLGIAIGELIPFEPHEYYTSSGGHISKPDCVIDKKPYMYKR